MGERLKRCMTIMGDGMKINLRVFGILYWEEGVI